MGPFKGVLWGFHKCLGFRVIWWPLVGFVRVSIQRTFVGFVWSYRA